MIRAVLSDRSVRARFYGEGEGRIWLTGMVDVQMGGRRCYRLACCRWEYIVYIYRINVSWL